MPERCAPLRVTAVTVSAQLGGTERVLLDCANHAFEHDIALRVVTPRPGPLLEILNDTGVPATVIPAPATMLRGSQRPGALASLPAALVGLAMWARRLARHPFVCETDAVLSTGFKPHLATARLRQAPIVWHLHEFPPAVTGVFWRRLALNRPAALIANSEAVGRAWREAESGKWEAGGAKSEKRKVKRETGGRVRTEGEMMGERERVSGKVPIVVVANGIDLDRFRPRMRSHWIHQQLGIPREHRLIGMPAVLARWKGQLEVLRAFDLVAAARHDVHLVFVGGSIHDTAAERAYEVELRREIGKRDAGSANRVHHLPFQPRIESVYPELDLVVHYSTRPEAFGRVVLEAMACGIPIIAAAEGGSTEIVTEGGWLVEPRNPAALARALSAALAMDPAALRQVGSRGRLRAEDRYSARRFAKEVAGVLWAVVRSPSSLLDS